MLYLQYNLPFCHSIYDYFFLFVTNNVNINAYWKMPVANNELIIALYCFLAKGSKLELIAIDK